MNPQPSDGGQAATAELPRIHFGELWNIFLRRIWIVVACALLAGAAVWAYVSTLPELYKAYGSLTVKGQVSGVFPEGGVDSEGEIDLEQMKTIEQELVSTPVLLRVVEKFELASDLVFAAGGLTEQALLDTMYSRILVEHVKGSRP